MNHNLFFAQTTTRGFQIDGDDLQFWQDQKYVFYEKQQAAHNK